MPEADTETFGFQLQEKRVCWPRSLLTVAGTVATGDKPFAGVDQTQLGRPGFWCDIYASSLVYQGVSSPICWLCVCVCVFALKDDDDFLKVNQGKSDFR